jgi:hypothetical protein
VSVTSGQGVVDSNAVDVGVGASLDPALQPLTRTATQAQAKKVMSLISIGASLLDRSCTALEFLSAIAPPLRSAPLRESLSAAIQNTIGKARRLSRAPVATDAHAALSVANRQNSQRGEGAGGCGRSSKAATSSRNVLKSPSFRLIGTHLRAPPNWAVSPSCANVDGSKTSRPKPSIMRWMGLPTPGCSVAYVYA